MYVVCMLGYMNNIDLTQLYTESGTLYLAVMLNIDPLTPVEPVRTDPPTLSAQAL